MKFWIKTLGCKANFCESKSIINDLNTNGYRQVKAIKNAEIIILNTCTITKNTDAKMRNLIARVSKKKKIVIVVGCYCQNYFHCLKKQGNLHIVLGNSNKNKIVPLLQCYFKNNRIIRKCSPINKLTKFENLSLPSRKFGENTRAFLKIQDGCNQKCSYCIIPYVRGKTRSKNYYIVLKEIKQLATLGYKEIVLTGINLTSYNDQQLNFYDLLLKIDKIPGNFRIRISSLEPTPMIYKIIDLFADNQRRWCKQLHLCLQSASNHVLKTMNRPYTIEQYFALVNYARKKIKNVAITTDYIVGFPSETQNDFKQAIVNLKKIKFANINVFCYSRRKKTLADREYKKDLAHEIIAKRWQIINQIKLKCALAYKKKLIGQKIEVIVQKNKNNVYYGYSSEYVKVLIKEKENCRRNKLVNIIYKKHNLTEQI